MKKIKEILKETDKIDIEKEITKSREGVSLDSLSVELQKVKETIKSNNLTKRELVDLQKIEKTLDSLIKKKTKV